MMKIAVLATLDSKSEAAAYMCEVLQGLGVEPWLMDLSLMPHDKPGADIGGEALAKTMTYLEPLFVAVEARHD